MAQEEKVRENRLRRAAGRRGLALRKSRTRDPRALTYDRWLVLDPIRNMVMPGCHYITLDAVEEYLDAVAEHMGR